MIWKMSHGVTICFFIIIFWIFFICSFFLLINIFINIIHYLFIYYYIMYIFIFLYFIIYFWITSFIIYLRLFSSFYVDKNLYLFKFFNFFNLSFSRLSFFCYYGNIISLRGWFFFVIENINFIVTYFLWLPWRFHTLFCNYGWSFFLIVEFFFSFF